MREHITVYCRRSITTRDWLTDWLRNPDYLTAAESAGLREEVVQDAICELRVANNSEITYAGAPRPIQIARHVEVKFGEYDAT